MSDRPTIGRLIDLCEENYRAIIGLAPDLRTLSGSHGSRLRGRVGLHLKVLEQTPHSSLIHLTHYFCHENARIADPAARLRVYYDARQVEVISLRLDLTPALLRLPPSMLETKWRLNLFLSKWLEYCRSEGHGFRLVQESVTGEMEPARAWVDPRSIASRPTDRSSARARI
jgi:uncharacterized protein